MTVPRLLLVLLLALLVFPVVASGLPRELQPLLTLLFMTVFLVTAGAWFAYLAFFTRSPLVLRWFSLVSAILCALCVMYLPSLPTLSGVPLWGTVVTAICGLVGGSAIALSIKAMHDYVFR